MRVNISVPEPTRKILQETADKHYDGNFSRFLVDAGLMFKKKLEKEEPGNV